MSSDCVLDRKYGPRVDGREKIWTESWWTRGKYGPRVYGRAENMDRELADARKIWTESCRTRGKYQTRLKSFISFPSDRQPMVLSWDMDHTWTFYWTDTLYNDDKIAITTRKLTSLQLDAISRFSNSGDCTCIAPSCHTIPTKTSDTSVWCSGNCWKEPVSV